MMCAREPSPWPATFAGVDEVAELVTLVVRPELRGDGVGSTMLDAFDGWLAEVGVPDAVIGVVPANTGATALYRRRGFEPTWLTLTRFGRAPGPPEVEASVMVEPVAARDVAGLEPLWLALHRHHQTVAPELAPFVADGPSWEIVRGLLAASVDDRTPAARGPSVRPARLRLRRRHARRPALGGHAGVRAPTSPTSSCSSSRPRRAASASAPRCSRRSTHGSKRSASTIRWSARSRPTAMRSGSTSGAASVRHGCSSRASRPAMVDSARIVVRWWVSGPPGRGAASQPMLGLKHGQDAAARRRHGAGEGGLGPPRAAP